MANPGTELQQLERQADGTYTEVAATLHGDVEGLQQNRWSSRRTFIIFLLLFIALSTTGLLVAGYVLGFESTLRELAGAISATHSGFEPSVAVVTSTLALATATMVPLTPSMTALSHNHSSRRYAIFPGAAAQVITQSARSTADFEIDVKALAVTYAGLDYQPLHRAFPVHAVNTVNPRIARQVKHNLKECAQHLAKRTEGGYLKGPNIGQPFEGNLIQCKAAVDKALHEYYGHGHHEDQRTQVKTPRPANTPSLSYRHEASSTDLTTPFIMNPSRLGLSTATYKVKGHGATPETTPSLEQKPVQTPVGATSSDPKCVAEFCDWMTDAYDMDRCYYRNESAANQPDWNNHTVTDFKHNAPLECHLCLPSPDRDGIVDHCKSVATRENNTLWTLVGTLVALLLGTLAFWLATLL